MSKLTLLELVQDILSDLDSDPVNSISDTVEALQVAQILKTTYNSLMDGRHWPHLNELGQLEALSDTEKPNYFKIPDKIINVDWVKYNTRSSTDTKDTIKTIVYKTPADFLDIVDARDSSASNVQVVVDFSKIPLNILNDKAPQYFTSFDDEYIVFDSFDVGVDDTLKQSKSSVQGRRKTTFSITNLFVPDLPAQSFSMLLAEAKAVAFSVLKQTTNAKAEQHSVTQRRRMSQDAWKLTKGITYPHYGRK